MNTATILNVQRFSLHDGPGIRTTVFVKGCPLNCLWCHNPESIDYGVEISVADNRCLGCGLCEPVCSHGLTGRVDLDSTVNRPTDICEHCGSCAEACPSGARELLGRGVSVKQMVAEVVRDAVYFEESSGGVTFSGGEPLSRGNAPFVLECLTELAAAGIHTTIDTCGHVDPDTMLEAANLADLILFDLKIMDSARHLDATGRDNQLIHTNLRSLLGNSHQVWIRVPLIPGMTDDKENLEALGNFLVEMAGADALPPVHILPYNHIASDKYRRLGMLHNLAGTREMTPDEIESRAGWIQAAGCQVQIGG